METDRDITPEDGASDSVLATKRVQFGIALSLFGLMMVALGLAIDIVLRTNDPDFVGGEGTFPLGNPGQALLGIGIVATAVGLGLAVYSVVTGRDRDSWILPATGIAAVLAIAALVVSVAYALIDPGSDSAHGNGNNDVHFSESDEEADQSRIPREEGLALSKLAWSRSSSLVERTGGHHGGTVATVDDLTPAEREELAEQFDAGSEAVERYANVEQAEADGYTLTSPRVDGVGVHYTKWSLVDGPFDPATPSQLLYEEVTYGEGLELVGLSYWFASEHLPEGFAGDADEQHQHLGTCFVNGLLVDEGVPERDLCAGDWINGSDLWMIHAWIVPGMENEAGVFAAANPRICERICAAEN